MPRSTRPATSKFPRKRRQFQIHAVFIAGFTILGVALAKNVEFRARVATLFDNDKVIDDCLAYGPLTGADRLLSLYLGVSMTHSFTRA